MEDPSKTGSIFGFALSRICKDAGVGSALHSGKWRTSR